MNRDDFDTLVHRIEWTTLLFFAAMFVTLECLERLRLIHWFSEQTINFISTSNNPNVQLTFAIIILLWVSQFENPIDVTFHFLFIYGFSFLAFGFIVITN